MAKSIEESVSQESVSQESDITNEEIESVDFKLDKLTIGIVRTEGTKLIKEQCINKLESSIESLSFGPISNEEGEESVIIFNDDNYKGEFYFTVDGRKVPLFDYLFNIILTLRSVYYASQMNICDDDEESIKTFMSQIMGPSFDLRDAINKEGEVSEELISKSVEKVREHILVETAILAKSKLCTMDI
jgi:hypothetical protein